MEIERRAAEIDSIFSKNKNIFSVGKNYITNSNGGEDQCATK